MKIPPSYEITQEMLKLISEIDSFRFFFKSLKIPYSVREKIHRVSLLKSSLFSARIEGNPLTEDTLNQSSEKLKKKEIFNILKAALYIEKQGEPKKIITIKPILTLHSMVMDGLHVDAGNIRHEMSAIFNQAGVAIYVAPPPERISKLLYELLNFINGETEKFPLLKAFIAHLIFEKVHPFLDGNGRIGRLLIYMIFKSQNYDFGFFVPFEEYLDKYKNDYYYFLDIGLKQTNKYLIFMLQAYKDQLEVMKKILSLEIVNRKNPLLPPRQDEILQIIKDHKIVSIDFIQRRFFKIPSRTLRYDLKKLLDKKLIIKIGKTKGSFYTSKV